MINYYGRIDRAIDQIISEIDKENNPKEDKVDNEKLIKSSNKLSKMSLIELAHIRSANQRNKKFKNWRASQTHEENHELITKVAQEVFSKKELANESLIKRVCNLIDPHNLELSRGNVRRLANQRRMSRLRDYEDDPNEEDLFRSISLMNISKIV